MLLFGLFVFVYQAVLDFQDFCGCGELEEVYKRQVVVYCLSLLSYYIIVLFCRTVLSYNIVVLYCRIVLSYCIVVLYCRTVVSYCIVVQYCRTESSDCIVVLYCRTVLLKLIVWRDCRTVVSASYIDLTTPTHQAILLCLIAVCVVVWWALACL